MRKKPKIIRTSQLKEHISKMVMEQGRESDPIGGEVSRSIFDAADALVSIIDTLEASAQMIRRDCAWGSTSKLPEYLDSLSDTRRIEDRVQEFHDAVDRAVRIYERDNDIHRYFETRDKILELVGRVVTRKLGK